MEIKDFTASIRDIFGEYPANSKGCRKFAKLIQKLFGGELYYNGEHFLLLHSDGKFYDLRSTYTYSDIVYCIYEGELLSYPVADFIHESLFGQEHLKKSFEEYPTASASNTNP